MMPLEPRGACRLGAVTSALRRGAARWLAVALLLGVGRAVVVAGDAPPVTDDLRISATFQREAEALQAAGQTVRLSDLTNQLARTSTKLKLARRSSQSLSAEELFRRTADSVVIVGRLYKCTNCPHWHVNPASGFALTKDGAVATACHVVGEGNADSLVVMRRDGKVFPVTEILAADPRADVAIVRAAGSGFRPLPLGGEPPVGATVRVISHPDGRFFALTEGIVSRYYQPHPRQGSVRMMAITADFARGSSGAPVMDAVGAVVGLVSSTQTINYTDKDGKVIAPQMVVKQAVPVERLRALIEKP